ncbi:MAG: hypothetical protein U1E53_06895 [Dongiaceae bacterium]
MLDAADRIAAECRQANTCRLEAFVASGGRLETCLKEVGRRIEGARWEDHRQALRNELHDFVAQKSEAGELVTPDQLEGHALERARALMGPPPDPPPERDASPRDGAPSMRADRPDRPEERAGEVADEVGPEAPELDSDDDEPPPGPVPPRPPSSPLPELFAGCGLRPTHPWIREAISDLRYSDDNAGDLERIGGGAANLIYEATYEVDGRSVDKLVKPMLSAERRTAEGRALLSVASAIGIDPTNPGYAQRNKATMLVAEALGWSDLVVDVDLGMHEILDRSTGTPVATPCLVMDRAPGRSARDLVVEASRLPERERDEALGRLRDDPRLQESLVRLQLLDAITGQADRHGANYFIDRDATGAVRGVKGIDNDECFGSRTTDPEQLVPRRPQRAGEADRLFDVKARQERKEFAWGVSLPPVIDARMREAIESLDEDGLRASLEGLLTEAEIDATMRRVQVVKAGVSDAVTVREWGPHVPPLLGLGREGMRSDPRLELDDDAMESLDVLERRVSDVPALLRLPQAERRDRVEQQLRARLEPQIRAELPRRDVGPALTPVFEAHVRSGHEPGLQAEIDNTMRHLDRLAGYPEISTPLTDPGYLRSSYLARDLSPGYLQSVAPFGARRPGQ